MIAVLPGRSGAVLAEFLSSRSASWRRHVKIALTDMASCYRVPIRELLPNATHVVDRFHVVRNMLRPLAEARRAAQRTPKDEPHDPRFFQNRYTFLRRADRLSAAQMAELVDLFEHYPHLKAAWEMTQRFHRTYEADGYEAAMDALEEFLAAWERLGDHHLGSAVKTLCRWADEVFSYHSTGGWTSGVAEGVNNKIEVLERKAYGFRKAANHQARILLECRGHPSRKAA